MHQHDACAPPLLDHGSLIADDSAVRKALGPFWIGSNAAT